MPLSLTELHQDHDWLSPEMSIKRLFFFLLDRKHAYYSEEACLRASACVNMDVIEFLRSYLQI